MLRLSYWLIEHAKWLVPARARSEFGETWRSELWHRAKALEAVGELGRKQRLDLLQRSLGAYSHALWLRQREWRISLVYQDLVFGLRSWFGRPAFALVAVVTLALGIGANTYIFSIVDGVLLHPFPYRDVDRLVALGATFPQYSPEEKFIEALSVPDYDVLASQSETLSSFLAFDLGNRDLGGIDEPQRLFTAAFWGDPFATLGMEPALGRSFTAEEVAKGEPVAIVSHRVWQQHFGGSPDAIGGPIIVNGKPRTLIGVMPPRLLLLDSDLWLPMWYAGVELPRSRRVLTVLARVKDDVSIETAQSELSTFAGRISQDLASENPEYEDFRLTATPFVDVWAGFVGPTGSLLLGAVGFVLLIVCANIGGLLLARAASRRHEMAVRTAVGAGRGRLIQQLLTEAFLLAGAGGILGIALAHIGIQLTLGFLPSSLPLGGIEIAVNSTVLAYTLGVSVLCGLVFGLAPAIQSSLVDVRSSLITEGGNSSGSASTLALRRLFVLGQVALSLVLLTGAGLVIKSFSKLSDVDPGMNIDNVLTMRLTLAWERYEGKLEPFYTRLVDEVGQVPGIRSVGLATQFPPMVYREQPLRIDGIADGTAEVLPTAAVSIVSPAILETLGIPLLQGRSFTAKDTRGQPEVAVINQSMAERYFPDIDPIGQRLRAGGDDAEEGSWATIVGIAANTQNQGADRRPTPEVYLSYLQHGEWANQIFLLVRTEREPMAMLGGVRAALSRVDPDQPVYAIETLSERFAATIASRRIVGFVLFALAAVALVLAAMGIYAVVVITVSERQREYGIRIALGAEGSQLVRRVLLQTAKLLSVGVVIGTVAAIALAQTLRTFLFEVAPYDPVVLALTIAILGAVTLVAATGPARRAARVDPAGTFK